MVRTRIYYRYFFDNVCANMKTLYQQGFRRCKVAQSVRKRTMQCALAFMKSHRCFLTKIAFYDVTGNARVLRNDIMIFWQQHIIREQELKQVVLKQ